MKLWYSLWGLLALLLAGCKAAAFSPTPTRPAAADDTAIAYQATLITEALQAARAGGMNYAYLPLVSSAGCDSYAAAIEITPDKVSLAVNETLKVTVVLRNTGCSSLGPPTYQIQPRKISALAYGSSQVQAHSQSIAPGESDSVEFTFTAKARGQIKLAAQADFEIHLSSALSSHGYPVPSPAGTRKQIVSAPVTITIK